MTCAPPPCLLPGMLRKTGLLGFLFGMLLPFFKCKESFGYVGVVYNYTQGETAGVIFYFSLLLLNIANDLNKCILVR